jgi:hypothetical protein
MDSFKRHWLTFLLAGALASFLLVSFLSPQFIATKIGTALVGHHKVDISAGFRLNNQMLIVTNQDNFDYEQLYLSLNEGYDYKVPQLAAGDSLQVPLASFVSSHGTHYAPATTTLHIVNLSTETSRENYGSTGWLVTPL